MRHEQQCAPVHGAADQPVAHHGERPDLVAVSEDLLVARPGLRVPHLIIHRRHNHPETVKNTVVSISIITIITIAVVCTW